MLSNNKYIFFLYISFFTFWAERMYFGPRRNLLQNTTQSITLNTVQIFEKWYNSFYYAVPRRYILWKMLYTELVKTAKTLSDHTERKLPVRIQSKEIKTLMLSYPGSSWILPLLFPTLSSRFTPLLLRLLQWWLKSLVPYISDSYNSRWKNPINIKTFTFLPLHLFSLPSLFSSSLPEPSSASGLDSQLSQLLTEEKAQQSVLQHKMRSTYCKEAYNLFTVMYSL